MLTTFDRYLLQRFLYVFFVSFVASYGLYVVIDGFTNVDAFQVAHEGKSPFFILAKMAEHYAYQSVSFLDLVGPILTVISVMVAFSLMIRNGELNPILSAGVPTYRLLVPFLIAAIGVNALLAANREVVMPTMADVLQAPLGKDEASAIIVDPIYDYQTYIWISGNSLIVSKRELIDAVFVLPQPEVSNELVSLEAKSAIYMPESPKQKSGWLLKQPTPSFDELRLTEQGRKLVQPLPDGDLFVQTQVSLDQLHRGNTSYRFLSTGELTRRIRHEAAAVISVRSQTMHVHERLTGPIMNIISVLLAVPFVARKESYSLITNFAVCALVMGTIYGVTQACSQLGRLNLMSTDLAAWLPVIIAGSACAWVSDYLQT